MEAHLLCLTVTCRAAVLMLVNLAIFLRVAGRYQYKTVARKREAPPHRRPQWLQPQVVDGVVIPVCAFACRTLCPSIAMHPQVSKAHASPYPLMLLACCPVLESSCSPHNSPVYNSCILVEQLLFCDTRSCGFLVMFPQGRYGVRSPERNIAGSAIPPDEDVGVYGRSVTFQPPSPMLPAPFR